MLISFLRKYKLSYKVSNFFNRKKLLHNTELYKKYSLEKKYYSSISSQDFNGINSQVPIMDREDSAQLLPKQKKFAQLDKKTQESLLKWSQNGFVVLESFFQKEEIDLINNSQNIEEINLNKFDEPIIKNESSEINNLNSENLEKTKIFKIIKL